jgi:hypothetical protein
METGVRERKRERKNIGLTDYQQQIKVSSQGQPKLRECHVLPREDIVSGVTQVVSDLLVQTGSNHLSSIAFRASY